MPSKHASLVRHPIGEQSGATRNRSMDRENATKWVSSCHEDQLNAAVAAALENILPWMSLFIDVYLELKIHPYKEESTFVLKGYGSKVKDKTISRENIKDLKEAILAAEHRLTEHLPSGSEATPKIVIGSAPRRLPGSCLIHRSPPSQPHSSSHRSSMGLFNKSKNNVPEPSWDGSERAVLTLLRDKSMGVIHAYERDKEHNQAEILHVTTGWDSYQPQEEAVRVHNALHNLILDKCKLLRVTVIVMVDKHSDQSALKLNGYHHITPDRNIVEDNIRRLLQAVHATEVGLSVRLPPGTMDTPQAVQSGSGVEFQGLPPLNRSQWEPMSPGILKEGLY
ncbi:hypothetical protein M231_03231 [Tremella mesenterica]|uniref:Uncharacterized protein n=1 Tax=Tremella mesenterica TaxID=5217 RepID=A0A4Q1BNV1_TREME|nr:hypothetical protein M231_03231 [Tremella mesenterica]